MKKMTLITGILSVQKLSMRLNAVISLGFRCRSKKQVEGTAYAEGLVDKTVGEAHLYMFRSGSN
jgi:hypothetical protein